MIYFLLKSLHIAAVTVWMAGLLMAPILIRAIASLGEDDRTRLAGEMRRIYRAVMTPAMALTWVLGIWLAVQFGWYLSGWMIAKFVVVLLLSGLNDMLLGQMRRLATVEGFSPSIPMIPLFAAQIVAILAVSFLVIFKPWPGLFA